MWVKEPILILHNLMGSYVAVYETCESVRSQEMDTAIVSFRSSVFNFKMVSNILRIFIFKIHFNHLSKLT